MRLNYSPFVPSTIDALYLITSLFICLFTISAMCFQMHQGMWRFASIPDLVLIAKTVTLSVIALYLILFITQRLEFIPRSMPFIQWGFLILALGGSRLLYRVVNNHQPSVLIGSSDLFAKRGGMPILLIGAEAGAATFIRATQASARHDFSVIGILAAYSGNKGRRIISVPVIGEINELASVIDRLIAGSQRPTRLVITERLETESARLVFDIAHQYGIMLCRMPEPSQIKEASSDDLIEGSRVLVTGAGGSIGSELVRQIAARLPAELVLLDQGEFNLYQIDHELESQLPAIPRRAILCDVRNRQRVMDIFARFRPELVFHAAALKHVPLVELNPCEGVLTNAIGTRNVADAASEHGVRTFVQVSTDKAVNPTNVMGASKRLAEFYCQALDVAVGLDIDGVRPGTVTHPDIKRFFMIIPEAVSLILHASAHGAEVNENERGQIMVLDMGQAIRIADLARQMIRIAGLEPDHDIKIVYTGLRPGEKLYEELFDAAETKLPAQISGLFLASCRGIELDTLMRSFDRIQQHCLMNDTERLRQNIGEIIPGYEVSELAA